jgi:transposase
LQADAVTLKTKSRLMLALVAQLVPLLEQIATYDKEIQECFLTHADSPIFASLPGAGKRLAPRLLTEWRDDRTQYADTRSIQALAGTSPSSLCQWQLCQRSPTLCLYQAAAQRAVPLCLAEHEPRSLGS